MKKLTAIMLVALTLLCPLFAQGSEEKASAEKRTLVLSSWALSEDALWADVYEPFEKEYNCTIVLDGGNASERYTKLLNDPNSTVDVIELSQKDTANGVAADAFQSFTSSDVPDYGNLIQAAKDMIDSGSGAPYTLNSIGIIYDPKQTGFEIKEWADLWKPELKGKVAVPDITTTFGPAMMYVCSDYKGVDIKSDEGKAAFEALSELRANGTRTYRKSSDIANLMANGEIAAAVIGDFGIPGVMKADKEAIYVVPESGTYANFNVINIAKKSQNRDLALAYINYRLDAETESRTCVTETLNEAPVNTKVVLSEKDSANKTVGDIAARAKMVDFVFVNSVMTSWVDAFNRTMNV